MGSNTFPTITSFVIRFVQEQVGDSDKLPAFRGLVRHIQTNREITFTRWEEAMAFMQQFVPIEPPHQTLQPDAPGNKPPGAG